ncbi:MAG: hypothetical protein OXM62_07215 [bacterium]|nr:hypothetical protein [bacterium]
MRILDLGTDQIPVGESITLDDLMAPTSQHIQSGYQISPGPTPADQEPPTPTRNREMILDNRKLILDNRKLIEHLTVKVDAIMSHLGIDTEALSE